MSRYGLCGVCGSRDFLDEGHFRRRRGGSLQTHTQEAILARLDPKALSSSERAGRREYWCGFWAGAQAGGAVVGLAVLLALWLGRQA